MVKFTTHFSRCIILLDLSFLRMSYLPLSGKVKTNVYQAETVWFFFVYNNRKQDKTRDYLY